MSNIPYEFQPSQIAHAAEVNSNFEYIAATIGTDSDEDELSPPGAIVLGPRRTMQIQHQQDAGSDSRRYMHLSWNTELFLNGSQWDHRRFIDDEPASMIRLGPSGVSIWGTSTTTGNLETQIKTLWSVQATEDEDYVFQRPSVHSQLYEGAARNIEDYRTSIVWLSTPATIFDGQNLSPGTTVYRASNYGISEYAKAIFINAEFKAGGDKAAMRFMQEVSTRHRKRGFSVYSQADEWNAGWGGVPLGLGGYVGKFAIERSAAIASVNAYIVGYAT